MDQSSHDTAAGRNEGSALSGKATAAAEAGVAAVSAGVAAVRRALQRTPAGWAAPGHDDPYRWRVVTVCAEADRLDPLPDPLASLGDAVEVTTRPAPGDRGTELAARLTGRSLPDGGRDAALQQLRTALRQSKQLVEVGWVLTPSPNASKETPLNAPLRAAEQVAGGEGRL